MRHMVAAAVLGVAGILLGCSSKPLPSADSPLTLDQWRSMPPASKYEVDTLERLKGGNPQLQDDRAWQHFNRTVLLPAKKQDTATARPGPPAPPGAR